MDNLNRVSKFPLNQGSQNLNSSPLQDVFLTIVTNCRIFSGNCISTAVHLCGWHSLMSRHHMLKGTYLEVGKYLRARMDTPTERLQQTYSRFPLVILRLR